MHFSAWYGATSLYRITQKSSRDQEIIGQEKELMSFLYLLFTAGESKEN